MKKNLLKGMVLASLLFVGMPTYADGVKWLAKCLDGGTVKIMQGNTEITPTIDATAQSLTIAATEAKEYKVTFNPSEPLELTNGQTYVVIE